METSRIPLRRNRDFNLLWTGQAVSDLGTRVADIAFPLLVLASTGSPGRAGIVGFAGTLPIFVFSLFAGALVDRANRKRLMIVCDLVRSLAFASLVVAMLAGSLTFGHIVTVAFIEGTGYVFFSVAERSALPQVVTDDQLPDALARNQAREYTSLLAGQPLGGIMFALGRSIPFLVNSVSYFLSVLTLSRIGVEFQAERATPPGRVLAEVKEGVAWFWRQRFVRDSQLLATAQWWCSTRPGTPSSARIGCGSRRTSCKGVSRASRRSFRSARFHSAHCSRASSFRRSARPRPFLCSPA